MSFDISDDRSSAFERIARALQGLQFGAVEITVHQGRIVQIERREKLRLDSQTARDTPITTDRSD